jgi:hypothetical protein
MRTALILFTLAAAAPAFADENIAGYWRADLGDDVTIEMNVSPAGQWNSETAKGAEPIAQMAGKYRQTVEGPNTGKLVFIPTQSHVTSLHGAPKVEYDTYRLTGDGQVLQLTSAGDTMEFHKLTK